MAFIKHHKHHFGVFAILIIIAVVSGYFAFGTPDTNNRMQNADNRIQTVGDTIQNTTNTVSDAENKKQITENKKNDLTPTATLSTTTTTTTITTSSTPAVEASGLTAGQAIQQLSTPVIIHINSQDYQTAFASSTTVYDLMTKLKSEGKVSFSGKEYSGMGFFVDEINGVKNDNLAGKYWIYYINGQSAQVGVSNYILKPNDLIEWKYENAKL